MTKEKQPESGDRFTVSDNTFKAPVHFGSGRQINVHLRSTVAVVAAVVAAGVSVFAWQPWEVTRMQLATDQQQAAILQTYMDHMQDLVLNHNLSRSKPGDEVAKIASAQTLTTLRRLDAGRNKIVLQFLKEAHLIGIGDAVINLSNADLSNDYLSGADLSGVDLTGANLTWAHLNGADLSGAHLNRADLGGADLSGADLDDAHLSNATVIDALLGNATLTGAHLNGAKLKDARLNDAKLGGTDLTGTDLSGAVLSDAYLIAADLTQQQLDTVYSCTKAALPAGLTCPHNGSP